MDKWEYFYLGRDINYHGLLGGDVRYTWDDNDKSDLGDRLKLLGENGWELVSAYPVSTNVGAGVGGTTTRIEYIFKRRVK